MEFNFYYKTFNSRSGNFNWHDFSVERKIYGYCKKVDIIRSLSSIISVLSFIAIMLCIIFANIAFVICLVIGILSFVICVICMGCVILIDTTVKYTTEKEKLRKELCKNEIEFCKEKNKIAEEEKRIYEENKRKELKEKCRRILKELDEDALCDIIQGIKKDY